MRRREFITLLGGAAVAWPLAARAQQAAMPVIGFLSSRSPGESLASSLPFSKDYGNWICRGTECRDRISLGGRSLRPIASVGGRSHWPAGAVTLRGGRSPPAVAAKTATSTIPIVFSAVNDPVQLGLVASLNRPGGNITGMSLLATGLGRKSSSY